MTNRTYKTGTARCQVSFLPPCIDEYVGPDNPVRAIDAYVDLLNLAKLGFKHSDGGGGAGQPAYNPADLLKLYLYGYINRVLSSRCLEREARRNTEVIWLLCGLAPGYRTIADFRKDNCHALKAANREFVLLAREVGLVGGELVAIDGAFFHGDASKQSIISRKRLAEQMTAVERDIEAYGAALDANDEKEASAGLRAKSAGADVAAKMAALLEKRTRIAADLAKLENSGKTQLSRTDPDARLLSKNGQLVAGYNVQIAVDDKHALIVANEVVNDGNDTGQLYAMATAAREMLAVETLQVTADSGYFNGDTLRECETDGFIAYVPEPDKNARLAKEGRFTFEEFIYNAEQDIYRCPAGAELRPMNGRKELGGKSYVRYAARQSICGKCPLRSRCLTDKARRREVHRWEHQEVVDRHRARMAHADAESKLRRRAALAEHPFGTLKVRAGYRHFLLRGFEKVRGELSLMALGYNFTRLLSIFGVDWFLAYLAKIYLLLARVIVRAISGLLIVSWPAKHAV